MRVGFGGLDFPNLTWLRLTLHPSRLEHSSRWEAPEPQRLTRLFARGRSRSRLRRVRSGRPRVTPRTTEVADRGRSPKGGAPPTRAQSSISRPLGRRCERHTFEE